MRGRARLLAVAAVLAAGALAAMWFGEETSAPFTRLERAALSSGLAIAAAGWLTRGAWWPLRLAVPMAGAVLAAAGFAAGARGEARAYQACVAHGEELRAALQSFRQREGHYPPRLELAVARERLCRRALRGSLLSYVATPSSYRLEFGDELVTFRATDEEPFLGKK